MLPTTSSGRWLAGITATVAALVVISLVVALATGSDEPTLLAEDTPEGTVQRYFVALDAADYEAAYALLADEAREGCTLQEFRRQFSFDRFDGKESSRVRLGSTRPAGDNVEVTVRVTRFYGSPPFNVNESTSTYRYLLSESDEGWRIIEAGPPFGCPPYRDGAIEPLRPAVIPPPASTPTPTVAAS